MNWSIDHIFFRLAHNKFGDMIPVWEHDLVVVKYGNETEDDGSEEMITGYFINMDENWKITDKHARLCDHCYKNTCDRMTYCTKLDTDIERLILVDLDNKTKRDLLYGYYTILKYGHLGVGNCRRVQSCVQCLVLDNFPVAVGTVCVGYVRGKGEE